MNGRRLDNQEISISDDTDGYLKRIGCPPSWIFDTEIFNSRAFWIHVPRQFAKFRKHGHTVAETSQFFDVGIFSNEM